MYLALWGRRIYIPFHAGVIVEDREQWFTEEPLAIRMQRQNAEKEGRPPDRPSD
jgi:hypothetical protein